MPFYVVTVMHNDLDFRAKHLEAHIEWLNEMVASDRLRLSGPLSNGPLADSAPVVALLILKAESKASAMDLMTTDPYSVHGKSDGVTVTEWDPIFGRFAEESGGVSSLAPTRS